MGKLLFLFSFFIFIFVLYFYSYSYSFVYSFIVLYIYIYRKYEYEDEVPVPLTGIDGQSRTSDEAVERPLQVRYDQKMAKCGQVAVSGIIYSALFQRFFLSPVKFMKYSKNS